MRRRLFYCDYHVIPLPDGHKFPLRKYRLVRERLQQDGLYAFEPSPAAGLDDIRRVHDAGYVQRFMEGKLPPQAVRRIGFPWSEGLVRRTLASVGGTLCATDDALERGWGGTLAGGTHHAFRGEGSGFCVFNDIAVAIERLRHAGRIRRAAVLDLDVHQGDGTARIFHGDPRVFTASMHGRTNFPFRKQQSSLDVELDNGAGDDLYLRSLDGVLSAVFAFSPEIVFFQSGVDALEYDTLGKLSLTFDGLRERDRRVMEAAKAHAVPLVITLGGGYARPIERTAEAHANTFRVAAEVFG